MISMKIHGVNKYSLKFQESMPKFEYKSWIFRVVNKIKKLENFREIPGNMKKLAGNPTEIQISTLRG